MSHERLAEPIKCGYFMDFKLPDLYTREMKEDNRRPKAKTISKRFGHVPPHKGFASLQKLDDHVSILIPSHRPL